MGVREKIMDLLHRKPPAPKPEQVAQDMALRKQALDKKRLEVLRQELQIIRREGK